MSWCVVSKEIPTLNTNTLNDIKDVLVQKSFRVFYYIYILTQILGFTTASMHEYSYHVQY